MSNGQNGTRFTAPGLLAMAGLIMDLFPHAPCTTAISISTERNLASRVQSNGGDDFRRGLADAKAAIGGALECLLN
jgi:hypothetical protein